jgi:hypothetical protein
VTDGRLSSHGGAHVEQLRGKSRYPDKQQHLCRLASRPVGARPGSRDDSPGARGADLNDPGPMAQPALRRDETNRHIIEIMRHS